MMAALGTFLTHIMYPCGPGHVGAPVLTVLTKSAVEPRGTVALESSSRNGIIAAAIVLTWHRQALVNICNNTDDSEYII